MRIPRQHRRQVGSNIPGYFVYTALKGFGFGLFAAIWVIYLQERRGLSLSQAALIDVTFFVAAALGEVPTGVVADTVGRKTSLLIGTALMCISTLAWVVAPTLPLIMGAYICLGIGYTFLSGAEDALFYESVQRTGRGDDYTRLVGRVGATMLGALALGSVASGLLAAVDLSLPFVCAGLSYVLIFGIVLTFKEPKAEETATGQARKPFGEILKQSRALMRACPALRYPMMYLALVPLAALILETLFVQPQALALGVPIAGVGLVVMALQITNMAGSTWSDRIKARFGEGRVLYAAPLFIVASLILLAALQLFPALLFIAVISFVTAVLQPIVLSRIQNEVSDAIRATILSMQSLMSTLVAAMSQPTLGLIADHFGLPAAYFALAGSLSLLTLCLLWTSRHHFPQPAVSIL